jgi:hypothetical protein
VEFIVPSMTHASTSDWSMARVEATSEYWSCLVVERAQRVVSAIRRSFRRTVSAVNCLMPGGSSVLIPKIRHETDRSPLDTTDSTTAIPVPASPPPAHPPP